MPNYKTTLELGGAYRFDATVLEDIFAEAAGFLESDVTVSLNFSDAQRLESDDISEILEDQLLRMQVITGISLSGSNYKEVPVRRFRFVARGKDVLSTIEADVEGNREDSTALRNELEDLIRAKRLWYAPLFPINPFLLIALTCLATLIGGLVAGVVVRKFGATSEIAATAAVNALLPVFFLLILVRKHLFPRLVVEIGCSADAASRVSKSETSHSRCSC